MPPTGPNTFFLLKETKSRRKREEKKREERIREERVREEKRRSEGKRREDTMRENRPGPSLAGAASTADDGVALLAGASDTTPDLAFSKQ